MICKVRQTIEKYNMIPHGSHVIVALSGGADSMSLLYSLNFLKDEFGFTLSAAHVNHGIRGADADSDEQFAVDRCNKLGIHIDTVRLNIPYEASISGEGLEECGRRKRYEYLNSLADDGDLIATAHNLNDRAETFLFNFTRGSGLNGLCSIPAKRDNIIRPLINCSREEIEKFCSENGIPYVTDKTNSDVNYSRNRIRHNVIPELKKINAGFDNSAGRCFQLLNDDAAYLDRLAAEAVINSVVEGGYDVSRLLSADISVLRRAVLKIIFENTNIRPDFRTTESVCNLMQSGGVIQTDGGFFVRVKNNKLDFPSFEAINDWNIPCFEGINNLPFADVEVRFFGKSENKSHLVNNYVTIYTLDYDKIVGNMRFRNRLQGDSIRFVNRNCTKTLRKLFNEKHVPNEIRDKILICADDEGIIFVDGFGIAERCAVDSETENKVEFCIRRKEL